MSQQLDNPFVGCTDVSKASGKQWMTKLTNLVNGFINSPIDNSSASSDVSLSIGQKAYVTANGATSIPLHIATASGQQYEIAMNGSSTYGPGTNYATLEPNNTTYSSAFTSRYLLANGASAFAYAGATNAFDVGIPASPDSAIIRAWTTTAAKRTQSQSQGQTTDVGNIEGDINSIWNDTTTTWASLGTLVVPIAWTGTVTIERKF